ncbi:methyltransferase domain-containing protein [Amycolatopsis minnesotensis]|uniref:Methyltransferase domain-containing protein n=2 Tax=Amycolatopsis minnesotensis TaxID=337894 RepID=A0ABP5BG59_9PSEU
MSSRRAAERAAFALPSLRPGMRIVDLGCGPGSITAGIATAVAGCHIVAIDTEHAQTTLTRAATTRIKMSTVDTLTASAYALPLPDESVDAVFAHALFEHLAHPAAALQELHRVLVPGGAIALAASDWSRAKIQPQTANVTAALRGHYLLRRRAGGDPYAGRNLATHVTAAGFRVVTTHTRHRQDMTYPQLATYVESRLAAALDNPTTPPGDHAQLASAARSAWTWTKTKTGTFTQAWTELLATK